MHAFKAFVFDGKRTAHKALHALEEHSPYYTWLEDVAEVSRSKHGVIRIHSTWAQDDSALASRGGFGAVTGGALGLLLGPAGVIGGAVAGWSIGALMGATTEVTFKDPKLDDFADALEDDTSALVLVGEQATLEDFTTAMEPFGGKPVEVALDAKDLELLQDALRHQPRA